MSAYAPALEYGLWGRAGLTAAPSRISIVVKVLATMCGYAASLLINGAASRLLPARFTLPPAGAGVDPLAGLGLVVRVCDPIFVLGGMRALTCVLLMCIMVARSDVPWATPTSHSSDTEPNSPTTPSPTPLSSTLHPPTPLVTDARVLGVPFVIGLTNALGYALYMTLTARGGVAIWSALVGLYVILPCAYGIIIKGEARTRRKLAGIALALVAGVLLVYSDEQAEASDGVSPVENVFLFIACIVLWGACDGLGGYVGRTVPMLVIVGCTGAGFATVALLAASVSYALIVSTGGAAPGLGGSSAAGAYALMFLAQLLGIAAWYASVLLGKTSEASSFLPITSLYTALTSVLAVVFLGEALAPLAWLGIVGGGVAMLLIATGGEEVRPPLAASLGSVAEASLS